MYYFPKIQTLFKRDSNHKIIQTEYTLPIFKYLENNLWECTEKIDGTNISIEITKENIVFHGRTENADIYTPLLNKLKELFTKESTKCLFDYDASVESITLFGEGYGSGIQSGRRYLSNSVDFILFDVRIGNWWLNRKNVSDIADNLNIKVVPNLGLYTIPEAISFVKKGFRSLIAEDSTLLAEGLVLRTPLGILDRNGERIITKIKTKDFK